MITRQDMLDNVELFEPNWTIIEQYRWKISKRNNESILLSPISFRSKNACENHVKSFVKDYFESDATEGLKLVTMLRFRWHIISTKGKIVSSSNSIFTSFSSCQKDALRHGLNPVNLVRITEPKAIVL